MTSARPQPTAIARPEKTRLPYSQTKDPDRLGSQAVQMTRETPQRVQIRKATTPADAVEAKVMIQIDWTREPKRGTRPPDSAQRTWVFFNPDLTGDTTGDDMTDKSGKIFHKSVRAFVSVAEAKAIGTEAAAIRRGLYKYLRGSAQTWFFSQLLPEDQRYLRGGVGIHR